MHNNSIEQENPYIIYNLREACLLNTSFNQNIWLTNNMQFSLGSLKQNENIPITMHPDMDEVLYVVQGQGRILMGDKEDEVKYDSYIVADSIVFIPAGMWHKLVNQNVYPLKLISVRAICKNNKSVG